MRDIMLNALKSFYVGNINRHIANVEVYLRMTVGIGEHSDIQETIDKEIENLVSRSPNSEQEIRRFYKKPSNRQRIEDDLTEKKILEFLTQFAKIKEVEVNTKDIRGENK